jgi:predicted metalloprotease
MRWENFRRSSNVEQGRGGFRIGGGVGIGAILLILLASWGLGIDPRVMIAALTGGSSGYSDESSPADNPGAAQNPETPFVAAVLGETEDRWTDILAERGVTYDPPKLVLFSGATRSACGTAQSAMGPFYCPNDEHIYLDTESSARSRRGSAAARRAARPVSSRKPM